jgi:hypothetical protein
MLEECDQEQYHYNLIYPKNKSRIISKKKYLELNNKISKPITRNILKGITV